MARRSIIWENGNHRISRKLHPRKDAYAFFYERKTFFGWRIENWSFVDYLNDDLDSAKWFFGLEEL